MSNPKSRWPDVPVATRQYPVNLVLAGRRCLLVGGGRIAERKAEALVACEATLHVIAPSIAPGLKAVATTWEERSYAPGDLAGVRLVVTATGNPSVDQAVFEDAEAAGIWVNSADDPARCTFTLPAVVRRGPVMVTASTGGHSPALAAWLRARFEAEIGPEFEALAAMLSEEREAIRASGRSSEGLAWQNALDSDMLDLIKAGRIAEARERLKTCLSSS